MKYIIFIAFIGTIMSCSIAQNRKVNDDTNYMIIKIQKKNSWHVIYAKRNDTLFKIVSKEMLDNIEGQEPIKVGKRYPFDLKSQKENAPTINGIKVDPPGYVGCYQFDSVTNICLEPKKNIFELYCTNDLNGIYCKVH